ncbi:MAG TPA: alkaline phosphatase family protein [Polyangiaceae bacterium LLY-WYZ-15_(1-7)]|nr:nucleotide pyrophosphatase [Myxococcales bacterium]MAT28414.1 nucleotide pyrophosphatase [Sandaracinus sp.]HJK92946.1 alkaline phosphatase family protein [Polyangiaceae bacterium LLY-WYZ-15_(1-7)]MBJ70381.1 nucleotide pyrophosphatase [Sandaracinus sp.]HJL03823.1 alkaline phosphatase family protein [Polyangiaceae bacterium LLY-WYZ-15_(1-7)]
MRKLALTVFVDACGWDVVSPRPWLLPELSHRQPVESVFGYSSACLPAILSGRLPNECDHWSSWRWDPEGSPFRDARWLQRLPALAARLPPLRRRIAERLARERGWDGYFALHDMPLARLPQLDWTEKRSYFQPGGLNRGRTLFDRLAADAVPHHVSDWRAPEAARFAAAEAAIRRGGIDVAFVYAADLDGLMHREGRAEGPVDALLRTTQARLRALATTAWGIYDEVRLRVVSDHGMAEVQRPIDIRPRIGRTGLRWGVDYASVLDSTMARFWFLKPGAEARLRAALPDGPDGRWLDPAQAKAWGVHWADGRFGDAVWTLEPGRLLVPSDLGRAALRGMHGYRPEHADSLAALLSNEAPARPVRRLTDLFHVLVDDARWASGRALADDAAERDAPPRSFRAEAA